MSTPRPTPGLEDPLRKEHSTLREEMREDRVRDIGRGRRFSTGPVDRCAKLLNKIVFSSLLAMTVITAIPYGTAEPWWQAVFECAVFALTAIWIFEVLLRGSWQVKGLFILLPLLIITVFAFAQAVEWPAWLAIGNGRLTAQRTLTIDRYQTYLTARKALTLTSFLGLLLLHTSTPGRLRWLVRVVIGLGLASALFGILRQLLQSPDSTSGFVLPFLFYGMGYGQFISSNAFAYLMEMSFAILAGLVLGGAIRRDRVLVYLAIGVFVWTALVLSNSRGGIFSFVCQSIFLLFVSLSWYSSRRLSREGPGPHGWLTFMRAPLLRVVLIVSIVGTLIAGVFWMGGDQLALKIAKQSSVSRQDISDGTTRKEIWHSTWAIIKQNPWTGVGFGAYFLTTSQYQIGSGRVRVEQAHNDYLDLAANGGVIAVGLAAWFIAMLVWRARSSFRSGDAYRRAAGLGAAAGILDVGVHSLVDFGLQVTGLAVVFAALVVILVADRRVESVSVERKGQ